MSAAQEGTLTVQVLSDSGTVRLVAVGEIDASSARSFTAAAEQALAEAPDQIEVDLSDVEFIDSSGLRAIINLSNKARAQHIDAAITGISTAVRRVLEITGLLDTLRHS